MALKIQNTRTLIHPDKLKLKVLIMGFHGVGKTTWMSDAPNLGIGVCETGHGKGLLGVAHKGIDFTPVDNYADFDAFCSGSIFQDKQSIGFDSLSWAMKTFIKDKALAIPRTKGETAKRAAGTPEIDDWGTIAEFTRKLLAKLIDQDKHIIVTSGLRIDRPDDSNPTGETLVGPDVAGQMFLGSTAMFDLVLCLRTRSILRDPKDAKSRFTERYFVTENTNGILAKNRLSVSDKGLSFLPPEVVFNPEKGIGTFDWFLNEAKQAYTKFLTDKGIDLAAVKAA